MVKLYVGGVACWWNRVGSVSAFSNLCLVSQLLLSRPLLDADSLLFCAVVEQLSLMPQHVCGLT